MYKLISACVLSGLLSFPVYAAPVPTSPHAAVQADAWQQHYRDTRVRYVQPHRDEHRHHRHEQRRHDFHHPPPPPARGHGARHHGPRHERGHIHTGYCRH